MANSKEDQDKIKKRRSAKERRGKNASRKTLSEGSQETQKGNEMRDKTNDTEEKSRNEETNEPERFCLFDPDRFNSSIQIQEQRW